VVSRGAHGSIQTEDAILYWAPWQLKQSRLAVHNWAKGPKSGHCFWWCQQKGRVHRDGSSFIILPPFRDQISRVKFDHLKFIVERTNIAQCTPAFFCPFAFSALAVRRPCGLYLVLVVTSFKLDPLLMFSESGSGEKKQCESQFTKCTVPTALRTLRTLRTLIV